MAVKFSELSKKLKMTNLELRRAIKKLGIKVAPRQAMLRKEVAEEILNKLKAQSSKLKAKVKKSRPKADEPLAQKAKDERIELSKVMTVKEFASRIKMPVNEIISALMKNGLMVSINENIDFETASIIASDLGLEVREEKKKKEGVRKEYKDKKSKVKERPPVVVMLGHVDHGKTTLLDNIRKTQVVETESGGITQHIGAYQVKIKSKKEKVKSKEREITFLDTPGHEAFAIMRAHGARLTDIAVLVVAADDGVKPQTQEAIDHIKSTGIPAVVAINKIDTPGADADRVRKELAEAGLPVEGWGGSTPAVEVSAKKGTNIDELLEVLLLVVDMNKIEADPTGLARGMVIESHMQKGSGPLSTILVQKGVLNSGDVLVVGDVWGKIRYMENDKGEKIKIANPSTPARILGLSNITRFGDLALEVKSEKEAKEIIRQQEKEKAVKKIGEIGMAEASKAIKEGKSKTLKLIIKADVAGSLKAIKDSVLALSGDDVKIKVVGQGVGEVSVSDIELASASSAVVVAFRVKTDVAAKRLALQEKVKISYYEVIYELMDEVAAALEGLLEPEIVEKDTGRGRVLQVFRHHKKDKIIGARVTSGFVSSDSFARIKRGGQLLGEVEIKSLQRVDEKVAKIESGNECGMNVIGEVDIKEKDRLQFYKKVEKVKKLKRSPK